MAEVFISYARSTAAQARHVEAALIALGHSVWRDEQLPAYRAYSNVIEEQLKAASAVVVIWSPDAVASEWVRAEADVGRAAGKLVQASLDGVLPPLPFNQIQCANLKGWRPGHKSPEWDKVVAAIDELDDRSEAKSAPASRPRRGRPVALVAIALIVVGVLAGGVWLARGLLPQPAALKIALAPFRGTGVPAQAVAASLTDKLQAALPSGPVEVVSADDAAALAGADRDAVAQRLGVGLILGGDVEDDGQTINVFIRLDDARRHATLWTGQASGPAADPDPLTTHAGHLALEVLSCAGSALKPAGGLKDTQTLSLFFKACDLYNESSYAQPQLIFQLFDTLRQVAARAPNFAPGHSMLASSIVSVAAALPGDHSALLTEARNEANRARSLDPTDPDAAVAIENLAPTGDWSGRLAALGPALDAHPDAGFANGSMGLLLADMGYLDEGAAYLQKAAAADPFTDDYLTEEAMLLAGAGQAQRANTLFAQIAQQTPAPSYGLWASELESSLWEKDWDRASTEIDTGATAGWLRPDEVSTMRDLIAAAKSKTPQAIAALRAEYQAGATHGSPGDLAWSIFQLSSIGLVDDAYALAANYTPQPTANSADSAFLFTPATAPMRRDPRFMPLMARLGLLKYWRDTGKWPDFCGQPGLPYDCKAEASRVLGSR